MLYEGCSFNPVDYSIGTDNENVVFTLPEYNFGTGDLPELVKWIIEIESAEISKKYECTDKCIILTVKKNEPLCIKATPVTSYGNKTENLFFKPAGTVYPYGSLELNWNQGFTADIMQTLFKSRNETGLSAKKVNRFIGSFNWKKMIDSINNKISTSEKNIRESIEKGSSIKAFYNPWHINKAYLLDNLSFGEFSASYINTKSVYAVEKNLIKGDFLLSSFIPENEIIRKYGYCTVEKGKINTFICTRTKTANINYTSAKNISVTYLSLPIFSEEL